jgi:hypothetical protein
MQAMRARGVARARAAGARLALDPHVHKTSDPSWALPLHILMWSLLSAGAIAVLVVTLMH